MSPAAFLLIAVVVGVVGSLYVVARQRQTQRPDHAMDEFRREMQALAPTPPPGSVEEQPQRLPFRPPTQRRAHDPRRPAAHRDHHGRRDDPRSGAGSDPR